MLSFLFCPVSVQEDLPVTIHGFFIRKYQDHFDLMSREAIMHRLKDDIQFLTCQSVCIPSDAFHDRSFEILGFPCFFTYTSICLIRNISWIVLLFDVFRFSHVRYIGFL